MVISAPLAGANVGDGVEQPSTSDAPDTTPAVPTASASALAYAEFVAALRDALRNFHRPDVLARNRFLRDGTLGFGEAAGALELRALLSDTVSALFGNERDEKLRRAIELTY